jgi:hypothetical protein
MFNAIRIMTLGLSTVVFRSIITVAFQNTFCLEMYQNNIYFLFFKNIFDKFQIVSYIYIDGPNDGAVAGHCLLISCLLLKTKKLSRVLEMF